MKSENLSIMGIISSTINEMGARLFLMVVLGLFIGALVAPMFYNTLANPIRNRMWINGTTEHELKILDFQLKLLRFILWTISIISWAFLIITNII